VHGDRLEQHGRRRAARGAPEAQRVGLLGLGSTCVTVASRRHRLLARRFVARLGQHRDDVVARVLALEQFLRETARRRARAEDEHALVEVPATQREVEEVAPHVQDAESAEQAEDQGLHEVRERQAREVEHALEVPQAREHHRAEADGDRTAGRAHEARGPVEARDRDPEVVELVECDCDLREHCEQEGREHAAR
jgi:hypothetical protein